MAISKRLRFEILRRDNFACRYCHRDKVIITVDHVIPRTLGGTDHPSNLVASCDDCNAGKTSALPGGRTVNDVHRDLMHWAIALRGDWQVRETEAVVNAAAHVWQSYWMPEHQADPAPELLADFRRKALELYPEEFGADDLMLAAHTSAEYGINDLRDALDFAQLLDRPTLTEGDFDRSVVNMAVCVWGERIRAEGRGPKVSELNAVRESASSLYPGRVGSGAIINAAFVVAEWDDTDLGHALGRDDYLDAKPFHILVAEFYLYGRADSGCAPRNPLTPELWQGVLTQAFAARDAGYSDDFVLQGARSAGQHNGSLTSQMTSAFDSCETNREWYGPELKECALTQDELDQIAERQWTQKAEHDRKSAERAAAGDPWYSNHPAHPDNAVSNGVSNTNGGA